MGLVDIDEEELEAAIYEGLSDATPEEVAYYFLQAELNIRKKYLRCMARTKDLEFRIRFNECFRGLLAER